MGFGDYLYFNTYKVPTAVRFQFSRIGNDPGAAELLEDLGQDEELGEFIDVFPVEFDREGLLEDKWFVVCYNLLFRHIDLKLKTH